MSTTTEIVLSSYSTPQLRKMTERTALKLDDLKRQKSLASRTSCHMDGQDEIDMLEIVRMLNNQIEEVSGAIREFRAILAKRAMNKVRKAAEANAAPRYPRTTKI